MCTKKNPAQLKPQVVPSVFYSACMTGRADEDKGSISNMALRVLYPSVPPRGGPASARYTGLLL